MRYMDSKRPMECRNTGRTGSSSCISPRHPGRKTELVPGIQGKNQWHPDQGDCGDLAGKERILTRLTRLHAYEGPAFFRRNVEAVPLPGERYFLEAERSRELFPFLGWKESGFIYGRDGVHPLRILRITEQMRTGKAEICLCCDNRYPSWPTKRSCILPRPPMKPRRTGMVF